MLTLEELPFRGCRKEYVTINSLVTGDPVVIHANKRNSQGRGQRTRG